MPDPARFNPFPGLRPFQMDEEHLFFGREQQRKELIALLREHRFVAVLGASGSGKSSLVRAGLLPALYGGVMTGAGSHWQIAVLRPGASPMANLAAALIETELWAENPVQSPLDIETTLTRSALGLVEAARQARLPSDHNLLVVVDQFEELFRFSQSQSERGTRDEASAFVSLLLEATRQTQSSIYVVLTMRSDFFGDCSQFEDLADAINKGEYLVPRLTREQKKQAIEGPVKVGGAAIATRLVQRLLNDVGDDPDQLPVLQHALMRTWDRWEREAGSAARPLDLEDYESIGGMREALSHHADEVYNQLPDDRHRVVAARVFQALTERGSDNRGIRRPTRLSHLAAIVGASEDEVGRVVGEFRGAGRTFLMPPSSVALGPDTVIDISHESLMRVWQRLRRWVEEEAQSARVYRRLADSALLHRDGNAGLYRDPDLQIAWSWRDQARPTAAWAERYHEGFALAMAFLDASGEARNAEEEAREAARQRELEQARALAEAERERATEQAQFAARLKWLVRGLGLVAMIAIVAFVAALAARRHAQVSQQRAEKEARIAEEQRGQATLAKDEAQSLAGQLKTTLTRADFATAIDQLNAGATDKALAYLARSMRTDPDFWPAPFLAKTILSENAFPTVPHPKLSHDEPIVWWSINDSKTVIWTVDIQDFGALWDAETGRKIGPLAGGKKVGRVHFTRDGLVFAMLKDEQTIRGWEAATGAPATPELRPPPGFGDYFVCPSTDRGRLLAIQQDDGSLEVWDANTGQPTAARIRTGGRVTHFGFTPDGNWVYGAFDDGVLGLWNPVSGEPFRPPIRHRFAVNDVVFTQDSRFMVMAAQGRRLVQWWDLEAFEERPHQAEFEFSLYGLNGFFFHPDRPEIAFIGVGTRLTGQGPEQSLECSSYDLPSGRRLAGFREDKLRDFWRPSMDPKWRTAGSWVVGAVVDQRRLKVRNLATGEVLSELPLQESPIATLRFSPDGGRMAVVTEDANVRIWDVFTARPLTDPLKHPESPRRPIFSPDGEKLITFTAADSLYRVWDARTGQQLLQPQKLPGGFYQDDHVIHDRTKTVILNTGGVRLTDGLTRMTAGDISILDTQAALPLATALRMQAPVLHATYDPPGKRILAVEDGGNPSHAVIWDAASLEMVDRLEHPAGVVHGTFSPDGARIVTACADRVVRVWDLATGKILLKLALGGQPQSAVFSPGGESILTSTQDGIVQVWDATTGNPRFDPLRHGSRVERPIFSPDGAWFVTGSVDSNIRVVDTLTGRLLRDPLTPDFPVMGIALSPDGRSVLGVGYGQTASVWQIDTGELIRTMPISDSYIAAAFHPNGHLALTAGGVSADFEQGIAYLWNWPEGKLHAEPLAIKGQSYHAAFSSDGRLAAAATAKGTLTLWDTATGKRLMERADHQSTGWSTFSSVEFRPDGHQLITFGVDRDRTIQVVDLPSTEPGLPEWFPSLVEGTGGRRLNESGALEELPIESLAPLRERLLDPAQTTETDSWSRWFLGDRRERPATPASPRVLKDRVAGLLESGGLTNLYQALKLDPNHGVTYARIGLELSLSPAIKDLPSHATHQWHAAAEWYSNQATNLAPASSDVWAMRAAAFHAGGRFDRAAEAAGRALDLDANNPNALAVQALIVAERGDPEQGYDLYRRALDATPLSERTVAWFNRKEKPFLIGGLAAWSDRTDHNPRELARAGAGRLDNAAELSKERQWEARWMTRRATELLPEDAEVWRRRAEVLFEPGEEAEALAAFKRSVDLTEEGEPAWKDLALFLRDRANRLERFERYEEAESVFLKTGIPGRSPEARPEQIDLSRHFNTALIEDPYRPAKGAADNLGATWRELEPGLQILDGVTFDVRGGIFLNGTAIWDNALKRRPAQVTGIPIGAKAQWLHFLHNSTHFSAQTNLMVGRYRLHYADGASHDFPVVHGDHVQDFGSRGSEPRRSRLAYEEKWGGGNHKQMFLTTWENPRPEAEITGLDFISSMTPAAPFLIAITLENPRSDDELRAIPAVDLAREAVRRVQWTEGLGQAGLDDAWRLVQAAIEREPANLEIQRARALVLNRRAPGPDAAEAIDRLLAQNPDAHGSWALQGDLAARSGRTTEALDAYQKAIALLAEPETFDGLERQSYIREAFEVVLRGQGRLAARRFFVRQNIPARDPGCAPAQIDLGDFYNGALNEPWFQRAGERLFPSALKTMPRGLIRVQGLDFDVRGVVQLNDRRRRSLHAYPNDVTGIRAGVRADLLHFIHATSFTERSGTVVARYRVHYTNGEQREFPVEYGRHTRDFYVGYGEPVDSNLAWRGVRADNSSGDNVLLLSAWENPLPHIEIERIDFVSELTDAQPFLLAVTAESFLDPDAMRQRPPAALAERAFHLANPALEPGGRVLDYTRALLGNAAARVGDDPETLGWLAQACLRLGAYEQGITHADRALGLRPGRSELWKVKSGLLLKLGRGNEAGDLKAAIRRAELGERIPARDPQTPARLIDLGPHYNAALTEGIHQNASLYEPTYDRFTRLATGVREFQDVSFDVRGIIHLNGGRLAALGTRVAYPEGVVGIQVRQSARRVHFLHSVGWGREEPEGTEIARYVVHYAGGSQETVPVILGRHVREWFFGYGDKTGVSNGRLACRVPSGIGADHEIGLYHVSWENPHPNREIVSLDYQSLMTRAAPFLVAITVE